MVFGIIRRVRWGRVARRRETIRSLALGRFSFSSSTGKEFYTKRLSRIDIVRYRASAKEHLAKLKDLVHAIDSYEKTMV